MTWGQAPRPPFVTPSYTTDCILNIFSTADSIQIQLIASYLLNNTISFILNTKMFLGPVQNNKKDKERE